MHKSLGKTHITINVFFIGQTKKVRVTPLPSELSGSYFFHHFFSFDEIFFGQGYRYLLIGQTIEEKKVCLPNSNSQFQHILNAYNHGITSRLDIYIVYTYILKNSLKHVLRGWCEYVWSYVVLATEAH